MSKRVNQSPLGGPAGSVSKFEIDMWGPIKLGKSTGMMAALSVKGIPRKPRSKRSNTSSPLSPTDKNEKAIDRKDAEQS